MQNDTNYIFDSLKYKKSPQKPLTSFSIHGTVEKGNITEVEACNAENLFLKESDSSARRNSYGGKKLE